MIALHLQARARENRAMPISVMTLNLWHDAGPYDLRKAAIRKWIDRLDPDFIASQEALDGPGFDQVGELLAGSEYRVEYAAASGWHRASTSFGNAVASRWPVVDTDVLALPDAGDGETLPGLLKQAQNNLPAERIATLAYDKAADDNHVHRLLSQARIKPLIQNRSLWKEEHEKMLPGHDGNSNIVYDEAGTLHCYDRTSQPMVRHPMAYIGDEPSRKTIKYRCPARHGGWDCPNDAQCNAGKKYGKTVRVDRTIDLRRFPPIPRATKKFERMYKGRTSVERVNARPKLFWGVDDGNITGARRFAAQVGVVMVVHAGLALLLAATERHDGTLGKTRLSAIQRALQKPAPT